MRLVLHASDARKFHAKYTNFRLEILIRLRELSGNSLRSNCGHPELLAVRNIFEPGLFSADLPTVCPLSGGEKHFFFQGRGNVGIFTSITQTWGNLIRVWEFCFAQIVDTLGPN